MYKHTYYLRNEYGVQTCPYCDHDLTSPEGVTFVAVDDDGREIGEYTSCLTESGELVDQHDMIAKGYHSTTMCDACGNSLDGYEHLDALPSCHTLRVTVESPIDTTSKQDAKRVLARLIAIGQAALLADDPDADLARALEVTIK